MSTSAIELPLFPLNVVLFPGTVRPLHIFEPRYRQMVKDCQRDSKPFGLVLAKPDSEHLHEEPYPIGTMARIHNLISLEDGGYNLMAVGTKRFRIISQHRERPYLSGFVEPFEDIAEPGEELVEYGKQARSLFSNYLNLLLEAVNQQDLDTNLPNIPEDLSHFIAYFLEVDDEQKQHYLELNSTLQRLQAEIAILRREIPFMRQILFKKLPEEQSRLN
ncbi:MAG TPA: LON peptidase substrate-binding domain-containing protein [Ktedonobacteraceae bacterium]|nr:LON peptidase substrate-binding domain-containing protein [Ktedonobacteraceae bacterium]